MTEKVNQVNEVPILSRKKDFVGRSKVSMYWGAALLRSEQRRGGLRLDMSDTLLDEMSRSTGVW